MNRNGSPSLGARRRRPALQYSTARFLAWGRRSSNRLVDHFLLFLRPLHTLSVSVCRLGRPSASFGSYQESTGKASSAVCRRVFRCLAGLDSSSRGASCVRLPMQGGSSRSFCICHRPSLSSLPLSHTHTPSAHSQKREALVVRSPTPAISPVLLPIVVFPDRSPSASDTTSPARPLIYSYNAVSNPRSLALFNCHPARRRSRSAWRPKGPSPSSARQRGSSACAAPSGEGSCGWMRKRRIDRRG